MDGFVRNSTILLLLSSFIACSLLDPCTLSPNGKDSPDVGKMKDFFTNATCTKGSIHWNYPRGALRVHFKFEDKSRVFKACLRYQSGLHYASGFDVSNGIHVPIQLPQGTGDITCTDTIASEVVFLLNSPIADTNMNQYGYFLLFQ